MRFTVPRTDVATGSGPLSVSGFGTLPSMTFSRPGDGEVLVTGLTFHLSLLTSGGGQTFLSPFNITCTLASGQIVVAGGLGGAAWWLLRRMSASRPAR
jgi:hypothetical protein